MGAILGPQNQATEEVKEQMMMMEKLLLNKIEAVRYQLQQNVNEDTNLPVVAVIQRVQRMSISISTGASSEVEGVIDDIFGGEFLGGLKKIVKTGLNALLGNASAGEKENTGFSVVYSDNTLLRVDYYMYKYDLTSKGVVEKMSNGFLYYVQISVLDLQRVNPQVVLYELTKSVGTENFAQLTKQLNNVEAFAKELYGTIRELKEDANPVYIKAVNSTEKEIEEMEEERL